jgi:uncharacterized membrane protein YgdD (TMEM256/DUF423 family)
MNSSPARLAVIIGSFFSLLGVLLGAFAAHFLRPRLVAEGTIEVWQTAILYQWLHALALLALGQGTLLRRGPIVCWTVGILLFSGSLYLLALDTTQKWAGPLTPLGGLFFIIGWVWFLVHLFRKA